MNENDALRRRLAREIAARKAAEALLEAKSGELFKANQSLAREATAAADLASRLDASLAELRATQDQQVQTSKLEALGTLAGGVAHELNTPIQYVADNLRFISDSVLKLLWLAEAMSDPNADRGGFADRVAKLDIDFVREELPDAVAQANDGLARAAAIIGALRSFAEPARDQWGPTDLLDVVRGAASLCRPICGDIADLVVELPESMPLVPCAASQIGQVLVTLVRNSVDAIQEGGSHGAAQVTIKLELLDERCRLSVIDNGPGFDPAIASRLFDLFFTTKAPGRGTGQGLALAHRIVTINHGGTMSAHTEPGKGATFVVELPAPRR